jgi:hypothetical protein
MDESFYRLDENEDFCLGAHIARRRHSLGSLRAVHTQGRDGDGVAHSSLPQSLLLLLLLFQVCISFSPFSKENEI